MATEQRLAVVTGAGSGIGLAIARRLARLGWKVCVAELNATHGEAAAETIRQSGGAATYQYLDVANGEDWQELHAQLRSEHGRVHLLVNNAGVCAGGLFGQSELRTWDWIHQVNLRGAMLGCHTFLPWLQQSPKSAYIMNVSSIAGLVYSPRMAAYNSSKAALVAFSETLHHELSPSGVGVTAVCPWFCPTNLVSGGKFNQASERDYAQRQMAQTWVTPDEVARRGLAATFRRRSLCVVGRRAQLVWALQRHCPGLMRTVIRCGYWMMERTATEVPSRIDAAEGDAASPEAALESAARRDLARSA